MVGHIDSRSCWRDEIRAPALSFVKAFRIGGGELDARQPFYVFLAEVSGHDRAQRITVAVREFFSIHFPNQQRARFQRFIDWNCVGVIVHPVETNALRFGHRPGRINQVAQLDAFPNCVAH